MEPIRVNDKKIMFGPKCFNLAPYKYQYARDIWKSMIANFWIPQEIPIADDLECYKNELNSIERHVVENVLAMLTTMDVQVADCFSESFINGITAPEVKATFRQQLFQESNHSDSYQYLIESLGYDSDDIYNRYITVPEMYAKVEFANEMAEQANKSLYDLCLSYFFFSVIFEGAWFLNGFSPIFSLQRRGLMRKTAEQLQYIGRDEDLHVIFGMHNLQNIMKENYTSIMQRDLYNLCQECVNLEKEYIQYILKDPILGYTVEDHVDQCKFMIASRCNVLGWLSPFENTREALPWLGEQFVLNKEKNFFETRVTEYRLGGLNWDEMDY